MKEASGVKKNDEGKVQRSQPHRGRVNTRVTTLRGYSTYLLLTAVDLPFLFRGEAEHCISMLLVKVKFILKNITSVYQRSKVKEAGNFYV